MDCLDFQFCVHPRGLPLPLISQTRGAFTDNGPMETLAMFSGEMSPVPRAQ